MAGPVRVHQNQVKVIHQSRVGVFRARLVIPNEGHFQSRRTGGYSDRICVSRSLRYRILSQFLASNGIYSTLNINTTVSIAVVRTGVPQVHCSMYQQPFDRGWKRFRVRVGASELLIQESSRAGRGWGSHRGSTPARSPICIARQGRVDIPLASRLAPRGNDIGLYPPVVHRAPTAEGRHRIVIRVGCPHTYNVLGSGRGTNIVIVNIGWYTAHTTVAVITLVAGSKDDDDPLSKASSYDIVVLRGIVSIVTVEITVTHQPGNLIAPRVLGELDPVSADGPTMLKEVVVPLVRDNVYVGCHPPPLQGCSPMRGAEGPVSTHCPSHMGGMIVCGSAAITYSEPAGKVIVMDIYIASVPDAYVHVGPVQIIGRVLDSVDSDPGSHAIVGRYLGWWHFDDPLDGILSSQALDFSGRHAYRQLVERF